MTPLQKAQKMMTEYDDLSHIRGVVGGFTAFMPLRDDCTAQLSVKAADPITAARRAIELYRMVKHGPEVVKEAIEIVEEGTPFADGDFDALESSLAPFRQEPTDD